MRRTRSSVEITEIGFTYPLRCSDSSSTAEILSTSSALAPFSTFADFVASFFGIADQLVETHRDGLPKVHRDMLLARGNIHQPVTVGEVVVGQTRLLGSEEQRNLADREFFANQLGPLLQPTKRVVQFAMTHSGCADNQCAIGYRVRDGFVLFSVREHRRTANRGSCLSKSNFVRVDYP